MWQLEIRHWEQIRGVRQTHVQGIVPYAYFVIYTEWKKLCGGRQATWQPGLKKCSSNFGKVGVSLFRG